MMYGSTTRENTEQSHFSPSSGKTIESGRIYKAITVIVCLSLTLIGISIFTPDSNANNPTHHELVAGDIRGGKDASGQDYEWMASWRFDGIHCCTGALIHKDPPIVATAAHCISCEQTTMDLKRTLTDATDNTAESHNILYWIVHPDYESPTISSHDIALVVLDGTTDIEPIEMVAPKVSSHNVFPKGTRMEIFGYGFIDEDDTIISSQLQEGIIHSWDKSECFTYLDAECDYGERWDNDAMLCGYDPNTSTERGDSGGPALMNGHLAGLNSWSPPSEACEAIAGPDYRILDVFVDIGSMRHWIESEIPASQTYFIGIHLCDDEISNTEIVLARLYGSTGAISESVLLNNSQLISPFVPGDFNVFLLSDINNIGWALDGVSFQLPSAVDSLCVDMVVAGRLDGSELATGSSERVLMDSTDEYSIDLQKRCGFPGSLSTDNPVSSTIEEHYYAVIIHVCGPEITTVGGSLDNIYARMHGNYGTSEWFQLVNPAMNELFVQNGMFIFSVTMDFDIGINIDAIEFQSDSNDALCIDMVTAGNAKYPQLWKGSRELFYIDSPCNVDPIDGVDCFELKSVSLICYDFD